MALSNPEKVERSAPRVKLARADLLHVVNDFRNGQGQSRPNQGVPMIGHQHVAAQQKSQAPPGALHGID